MPLSAVSSSVLQSLSSCSSESERDEEGWRTIIPDPRPFSEQTTTESESDEVSEVKIDDHARDAKRATVDSESEEY